MTQAQPQFRLLLVEDEPTQRMLLERLLRKAGYVVETASDGDEALRKILGGQFQILLTDWDMPGMDGATLCRKVRDANLPTYLYILLLTGHSAAADAVAGLESGADDYVRKPFNESELLARLNAGRRIVRLEQSLREANAQIQLLSVTDSLVGTFNRRYLNEQLVAEVERARRYSHPLSIAMADLDRFKKINDERGHLVGDQVLRQFAERVKSVIRSSSDWIARYGGEEFVIVLPETRLDGAAITAEKIRALCASQPVVTSTGELAVTASFGVSELDPSTHPPHVAAEALLKQADAAMYASKRDGRNRVTLAGKKS